MPLSSAEVLIIPPLSPELMKTHTHAKYIENIVFEPSKLQYKDTGSKLIHTLLLLVKTEYVRKNVQSERCREARKNPRLGENLCWGQGTISSFLKERIEHKITKQIIKIPRDCITLSKSFVVYCTYLFLEAGCRQPACLSMILSLSSLQPGFEAAPDFMLWRPKSSTFETNWPRNSLNSARIVEYDTLFTDESTPSILI